MNEIVPEGGNESARLATVSRTPTKHSAGLSRREQNKLDKRGRIVAAARALFTHKGFEATTTQEIAEAAGVAAGTVFTYASTKDDLLILIFHEEMKGIVERAFEAAQQHKDLLERAIAFFDRLVAYHERDVPLARALMRQLGYVADAGQRSLVTELMRPIFARLALLVQQAKTDGEITASCPLQPAARSLFAIYYLHLGGFLSGYFDRARFDRTLRTDLGLLLAGLAERPPAAEHASRTPARRRRRKED